jgi:hypothetical protein
MNMRRWRDRRVGLDLDAPSELTLLKATINAAAIAKKIEVKRTGHGYHVRIFKKHSLKQNFDVRRDLCDDPQRIEIDEKRQLMGYISTIDTLFNGKMANGVVTREEDVDVLSLPFNDRFPAKKVN